MPITQDRMIALIAAARAFETALTATRREIVQRNAIVQRGGDAAHELAELLNIIRPEFMVAGYTEHFTTLAIEERHFATHQRYNERRAVREEHKRRKAGIMSRPSAPPTLVIARQPAGRLSARTIQSQPSIYDEAGAEWTDPSLASDPEAAGGGFMLHQPSPGLSEAQRATIEAELDALEGRGEPGEVE